MTNMFIKIGQPMPPLRGLEPFGADLLQICHAYGVGELGIWESVFNPGFNYGEFAIIKSQVGLNSYKISVKDWVARLNQIVVRQMQVLPRPNRPVLLGAKP